jgi:hypothetical protein
MGIFMEKLHVMANMPTKLGQGKEQNGKGYRKSAKNGNKRE